MTVVIHIGTSNSNGHFTSKRWKVIIEWLAGICNSIRLYTKLYKNQIVEIFSNEWMIDEEPFPDPNADLRGFRLWGKGVKLWNVLMNLSFDPENGITYSYFMYDDKYIGELEVEDSENFLILHLTESQEKVLLKIVPDLKENVEICATWYEILNDMIEDDEWKPLGGSGSHDLAKK